MARGRRPNGERLIENLSASADARRRMWLIVQSLTGGVSIQAACEELGICESRFHAMRSEYLESAVHLLEPKPTGRPSRELSEEAERITKLEDELAEMKLRLFGAQVREEVARIASPDKKSARLPSPKKRRKKR